MKVDVNKAAECALEVQKFGNTEPADMFSNCASLIETMPDNEYKDAIISAFGASEGFYNEEYLPVLQKNNKTLTETLPEFKAKIEQIGANLSTVKHKTVEVKTDDIDMGEMGAI